MPANLLRDGRSGGMIESNKEKETNLKRELKKLKESPRVIVMPSMYGDDRWFPSVTRVLYSEKESDLDPEYGAYMTSSEILESLDLPREKLEDIFLTRESQGKEPDKTLVPDKDYTGELAPGGAQILTNLVGRTLEFHIRIDQNTSELLFVLNPTEERSIKPKYRQYRDERGFTVIEPVKDEDE